MRSRALLLLLLGSGTAGASSKPVEKRVSFSILEDYDKGQDLAEVALDFELMKELEIGVLRCSFGWDDFEPEPGRYDFDWLQQFVSLAAREGIELRPYLAYTPGWAARGGQDDAVWNDPPESLEAWGRFVDRLARTLRPHPNVLSYEIYNEVNDALWWDGTAREYVASLRAAALAIRAADSDQEVLLAGLVYPDDDFLRTVVESGGAGLFDVVSFHAYPETWTAPGVTVENYLERGYEELFLPLAGGKPVWINEMGFATSGGRSERDQANWWARAVASFLAAPGIEHLGIYEIKDLPRGREVIGEPENYHLGITYPDRRKKLAFFTLDFLTDWLDGRSIVVADGEVSIEVLEGRRGELYHHFFRRADGEGLLFVYDNTSSPTLRVELGSDAGPTLRIGLDGASSPQDLARIELSPGEVRMFRVLAKHPANR